MDRKQFLQVLAVLSTPFFASFAGSEVPAQAFRGKRAKTEFTCTVPGKPEVVFPLLCPVREYEWIEGWRGELIYSDSGVAEDNCIFKTDMHGDPMIWSAIAYEPNRHVEYLAIANPHFVMRLSIELEAAGSEQTKMIWRHTFTGLSDAGNQHVAATKADHTKQVCEKLEYFLKTVKKLIADRS